MVMSDTRKKCQAKGPQINFCDFCKGCHRVPPTLKSITQMAGGSPTALSLVNGQNRDGEEGIRFLAACPGRPARLWKAQPQQEFGDLKLPCV